MEPAGPSAGLVNLDMEGDQGAGSSVPTLGPWGVEASVLMVSEWGRGRSGLCGIWLLSLESQQGMASLGSPALCGRDPGQWVVRV